MKRTLIAMLAGAMLAAASGMAAAHDRVSFGVYIGAPAYSYGPPPYYGPPPVYYGPPAYYYGPAYYGPAPWNVHFRGGHHRGWDRRHWH